jgi:hypothetical protein|tara:strand:+ start:766 stop:1362 length:597 start_codon:yes stop_codon:yes gene_type:complete
MPGQIKIDDGSGNYTILTNGGSLSSDKTITIPNTTGTMALTSDITSGLSSAQQFRLTANVTSTGDITSNWAVPNTENQGNLGSLVSESSGIFSFSSTGFYYIRFDVDHTVTVAANTFGIIEILLTDDNSTYTSAAFAYFGGQSDYDQGFGGISTIIDVTNTTNDKVKFKFTDQTGNPRINGSTTQNKSVVTFLKLGET